MLKLKWLRHNKTLQVFTRIQCKIHSVLGFFGKQLFLWLNIIWKIDFIVCIFVTWEDYWAIWKKIMVKIVLKLEKQRLFAAGLCRILTYIRECIYSLSSCYFMFYKTRSLEHRNCWNNIFPFVFFSCPFLFCLS